MDGQALMKKWFEGLNGGKLASGLVADGFTYHGGDADFTMEQLQARVNEYRKKHPELLFSLDHVVQHANKVGVVWSAVTRSGSSKGVGTAKFRNGKFVSFEGVMPNL